MTTVLPATFALATLLAAGPTPGPRPAGINPVVLRVNGEPIYAADISLVLQGLVGGPDQSGKQPTPEEVIQVATQRVVEQRLLAQEARRLGLKPDEGRVEKALEAIVQHAGSQAALDANLAGGGTSFEHLRDNLRELDLTEVYIDTQILPSISVTEEEVASFYQTHQERLALPERVHLRHILIPVAEGAAQATVEAALGKAEKARARALAGEDFAALARELSQDPSAPRGGDIGVLSADRMPEQFSKAALALAPGQISEVVRTQAGFHVVKLEERLPAGTLTLDEARPNLRKALAATKAAQAVANLIRQLAAAASIEPVGDGTAPTLPAPGPRATPSPLAAPAGPTGP